MENSQPVNTPAAPRGGGGVMGLNQSSRMQDEDEALGFECANPALQIERWGLEQALQAEAN